MTRVVEKARLKGRNNSAACVKDIVRAMVVVDTMDAVASVLETDEKPRFATRAKFVWTSHSWKQLGGMIAKDMS